MFVSLSVLRMIAHACNTLLSSGEVQTLSASPRSRRLDIHLNPSSTPPLSETSYLDGRQRTWLCRITSLETSYTGLGQLPAAVLVPAGYS